MFPSIRYPPIQLVPLNYHIYGEKTVQLFMELRSRYVEHRISDYNTPRIWP